MARLTAEETVDLHSRLLAAFRELHENSTDARLDGGYTPAARAAGTTKTTAKRAFLEGWPGYGLDPIRDILVTERHAARAAIAGELSEAAAASVADEAQERARARADAIKARAEEGKLVRAARGNVVELLESCRDLLGSYRKLAPSVKKLVANVEDKISKILDDPHDTDVETMLELVERVAQVLWRLSTSARASTAAGMQALQMERLLLGQPTEIIGVTDLDSMSEDEAINELEEAARAAERMKARRNRRLRLAASNGRRVEAEDEDEEAAGA